MNFLAIACPIPPAAPVITAVLRIVPLTPHSCCGIDFLADALAEAVDDDREDHHCQAGLDAATDLKPRDRADDLVAQTAGADHGGDDHHGERHHDTLVDAGHDR